MTMIIDTFPTRKSGKSTELSVARKKDTASRLDKMALRDHELVRRALGWVGVTEG